MSQSPKPEIGFLIVDEGVWRSVEFTEWFKRTYTEHREGETKPSPVWFTIKGYGGRLRLPRKGSAALVQEQTGLPRILRLFSFLLPKKTREHSFEPAFWDLKAEYLETRSCYRTKWARRWLKFCFGFRAALLIVGSVRAMVWDWLADFVPVSLRGRKPPKDDETTKE